MRSVWRSVWTLHVSHYVMSEDPEQLCNITPALFAHMYVYSFGYFPRPTADDGGILDHRCCVLAQRICNVSQF